MPFGKKDWYKGDRFRNTIPDIFRHPALTYSSAPVRAFSDPGIIIKLNGIDFDVPENGTPGGITPPRLQQPTEQIRYPEAIQQQQSAMDLVTNSEKLQCHDSIAEASLHQLDGSDHPTSTAVEGGASNPDIIMCHKRIACKHTLAKVTSNIQSSCCHGITETFGMESDRKMKPIPVTVEYEDDSAIAPEDRQIRGVMLRDTMKHVDLKPEPFDKEATSGDHQVTEQAKKKKSRNRNSGAKRGPTALNKIRGTGFEDGYADPPMTREEFEEEKRIYDPRIEECIQRYRGRRRMDATRDLMFSRYLNMGGIDTSQRQFTGTNGISKDDLAGLSKAEKRMAAANDVINRRGDDPRWFAPGDDGWTVDFASVVAAYLSNRLPFDVGGDHAMIALGIDTILNFINYVIKHDVCPEYEADLARARAVCKLAKIEFPMINKALAGGMGQFNYACRTIFNLPDETDTWVDRMSIDPARASPVRPVLVFNSTLTLLADLYPPAESIDLYKLRDQDPTLGNMASIVTIESQTDHYEVVKTREPIESVTRLFRALHSGDKITGHYRPAGVLVVRRCIVEDGFANTPKLHLSPPTEHAEQDFIVDRELLRCLLPGMKLQLETARVVHPDFELTFMKNLLDVQPSFRLFMPQMLMLDYKLPRENTRDPPSVNNPDAEGGGDGDVED